MMRPSNRTLTAENSGLTTASRRQRGRVFFFSYVLIAFVLIANFAAAQERITFLDITAHAGIHFTHNNGAFGKKWLPETMGPGCAFIDYDNDGYPDVILINGDDFPGHPHSGATTLKLYHNNHDGTFT